MCGCKDHGLSRLPWLGRWPGEAECESFGWYAKLIADQGWVSCAKEDPEATFDLNRLYRECRWDAGRARFVRVEE